MATAFRINGPHNAFAFERLGSVTTGGVVTLTATTYIDQTAAAITPRSAQVAFITVETNSIRVTWDGTTPTTGATGNGHQLVAGDTLELYGLQNIRNLKMIAVSATGAVNVTYSR